MGWGYSFGTELPFEDRLLKKLAGNSSHPLLTPFIPQAYNYGTVTVINASKKQNEYILIKVSYAYLLCNGCDVGPYVTDEAELVPTKVTTCFLYQLNRPCLPARL